MSKLTNVRERVHQPFRDALIRTAGWGIRGNQTALTDTTDLFTVAGRNDGLSNLKQGSVLPSDQSHVTLALRVHLWFKSPIQRGQRFWLADGATEILTESGDYDYPNAANSPAFGALIGGANGAVGTIHDVFRLYWQAAESLLWSFGTGDKFSLKLMPSYYMPAGGGLHGDLGTASDLILLNNGTPDHAGILRIARAILIPPRQNIKCTANIVEYDDGGNGTLVQAAQGTRNTLSLTDNLTAVDGINKSCSFVFDGLFSRDVQ
jgi:hypothetical protein